MIHTMQGLNKADFEHLGKEIGHAFISEAGPFHDYFTEADAQSYFACLCEMAYKAECLYELDEEKGYLIYWRKHHGPSWWLKLMFAIKLTARVDANKQMKYAQALDQWDDYEKKYRKEKDYIDLFMVCIPLRHQKKHLMKELLKGIMQEADESGIPIILDTDSPVKASKYQHLGMTVTDDMVLADGNHMYTLEYRKKTASAE